MHLDNLISLFDASPTLRLLKSDHAAFVLDFLNQTFKGAGELSIGHREIKTKLLIYIEQIHETMADALTGPADRYIATWSDAGWLARFLNSSSNEPQYQLTQHVENALQFVDLMLTRRDTPLSTESRLRMVIDMLTDLVRGSSDDPVRRLAYLEEQKAMIERQISDLKGGRPVDLYNPIQVRERFTLAIEMLKALQSDFRAVEERFYEIAHEVHAEQQRAEGSRGEILAGALDAEDLLKTQDEGISFYAFVSFQFSPHAQQSLRETIDEVTHLEPIQAQREAIRRVRGMLPSLLQDADKVLQTTGRLSRTLRKLLNTQAGEDRRKVADVLRDIKQIAAEMRDCPPEIDSLLTVQTMQGIASPFSRSLWQAPQSFDSDDPTEHVVDLQRTHRAGEQLAQLQRLDFQKLRDRITTTEVGKDVISLQDVIREYPPEAGVIELVSYLQIAHEDGHEIDTDNTEEILLFDVDRKTRTRVRVPQIRFQQNRLTNKKPR